MHIGIYKTYIRHYPKDPYVEGDRQTVRKNTKKQHLCQKTRASNLFTLWSAYAHRRL